jgi:hypothetical protein
MAGYERFTAAGIAEVLRTAEQVLQERIPLTKVKEDDHSVTLSGPDGTVTVAAHRHGLETLVHARTDRLRTERIDLETQYFLNQLPYQPGDRPTG